jgi:hypothetical protein
MKINFWAGGMAQVLEPLVYPSTTKRKGKKINLSTSQALVAHACNPSYLGG